MVLDRRKNPHKLAYSMAKRSQMPVVIFYLCAYTHTLYIHTYLSPQYVMSPQQTSALAFLYVANFGLTSAQRDGQSLFAESD